MTRPTHNDMVLQRAGVREAEELVYRLLLSSPGLTTVEIADEMGISPRRAGTILNTIASKGLITEASTDETLRFVALPPAIAVEALFARRIEELQLALAGSLEAFRELRPPRETPHLMELVSIVEGTAVFRQQQEQIQAAAQREVLVFDTPPYSGPVGEPNPIELELLSRGVSHRAVYDHAALGIEGRVQEVEACIAAGEQARVTPRLPIKLFVVDHQIALTPLDTSGPTHGTLLIHKSLLLDALVALFESFWERAFPLSSDVQINEADHMRGPQDLSQRDRRILHLLAAGAKDETIARHLGTSPVTIRRHIRRLAGDLGVETRFQAGMAATKRGWV